jgi:BTB/POZ domain-containing protein KCTD9
MDEQRLNYEASCERLRELGLLGADDLAPLPKRRPHPDDDAPLGVNFFRVVIDEPLDLSRLSLPRTFFGRSEIRDVSFEETDLHESTLCWTDFMDVSFKGALLFNADLRASNFERVSFEGADLRGADLRQSSFESCLFDAALMEGAVLTSAQLIALTLSSGQRAEIIHAQDEGPEPPGG